MSWRGHLGARPPILVTSSDPEVLEALSAMSKAALADIAAQSIALAQGRADQPITVADLVVHAEPVLRVREDRIPAPMRRWMRDRGY